MSLIKVIIYSVVICFILFGVGVYTGILYEQEKRRQQYLTEELALEQLGKDLSEIQQGLNEMEDKYNLYYSDPSDR